MAAAANALTSRRDRSRPVQRGERDAAAVPTAPASRSARSPARRSGLRGKSLFADTGHGLPSLLRPYLEYDVHPPVAGSGRPAARVVLSDKVPYASWYSPDHYASFLLMFPIDCVPNVGSLGPPDSFDQWGRGGS